MTTPSLFPSAPARDPRAGRDAGDPSGFVPVGDEALPLYGWTALRRYPVEVSVSTRAGGTSSGPFASLNLGLHVGDRPSAVTANRALLARACGHAPADAVFAEQTHGTRVAVVGDAERGRGTLSQDDALPGTDALITRTPGVTLVIMVADCVPIVLYDPVGHTLACVHAGWGGTVRGITPTTLETLHGLGADPANLVVGVGPSIAPNRYQVGREVAEAARATFGDRTEEVLTPDPEAPGRWRFDLWRAAVVQLVEGGVDPARIHLAGADTGPGTPFFSHRREGPTGRFALVARLAAPRPPDDRTPAPPDRGAAEPSDRITRRRGEHR